MALRLFIKIYFHFLLNTAKYSLGLLLCCIQLLHTATFAQNIEIHGSITGENNELIVFPIIANRSTGHGMVANSEGKFVMKALKTDTILINATGYSMFKFCAADSTTKDVYEVDIHLSRNVITLKEIIIHDIKSITDINREKEKLGIKNTDDYQQFDGLSSPLTWLYERFSKNERDKRLVASLENKDRQIALLKDLFRNYISYDVMDLDEGAFENFINYMQLPESFIKSASDYELAIVIKSKYNNFKKEQAVKF